jgi:hypothetical protein
MSYLLGNNKMPYTLDPYVPPALNTPYSDQLFDISTRTGKANTAYSTLTRAYMTIAQGSYLLANMRIMFMNTVKLEDWIRLGLYSEDKQLLQKTDRFHPVQNKVVTVPLLNTVQVDGGGIYYAAFSITSTAAGNTFFPVYGLGDTMTEEPLIQLSDTGNEMPNSLGAGGLVSANRVWLGWTA